MPPSISHITSASQFRAPYGGMAPPLPLPRPSPRFKPTPSPLRTQILSTSPPLSSPQAPTTSAPAEIYADDSPYEEDLDLDMTDAATKALLVRIPSYIWEQWESLGDDEEIVLGEVKCNINDTSKWKLNLLHGKDANGNEIPTEFDMYVKDGVENTFVFREEELPPAEDGGIAGQAIPKYQLERYEQRKSEKAIEQKTLEQLMARERARKNRKSVANPSTIKSVSKEERKPSYRTTKHGRVSKGTALIGKAVCEGKLVPVANDRYFATESARHAPPKPTAKLVHHSLLRSSLLAPGMSGVGAANSFKGFIKKTGAAARNPNKDMMVRSSKSELLSGLFRCFFEREVWSVAALRQRLQQPEVWLREVLSEVASDNNGRGWTLLPEHRHLMDTDSEGFGRVISQDVENNAGSPGAGEGNTGDGL